MVWLGLARKFECTPANLNRVNLNGSHDVITDKLKNLNFNISKYISIWMKLFTLIKTVILLLTLKIVGKKWRQN